MSPACSVITDQTAIPIRLSKAEMSVIWPGLNFMVLAWGMRERTGTCPYSYPFRIYPFAPGHDTGTFNSPMMNLIVALRSRLGPIATTGGKVQLNAIEVRVAILSARINLEARRHKARAREMRRKDAQTKRRMGSDKASIAKLKKQSKPVINSLENTMKRANRRFLKVLSQSKLVIQSIKWQRHLRWMRYHILYFKPLRPVAPGHRSLQRKQINRLVAIAEAGLQDQAYELPSKEVLRSMMRLFARSSRRGRMGELHHRYVLQNPESGIAQFALVDFLEKRLDLKHLPD
jgi:hypothetical protein